MTAGRQTPERRGSAARGQEIIHIPDFIARPLHCLADARHGRDCMGKSRVRGCQGRCGQASGQPTCRSREHAACPEPGSSELWGSGPDGLAPAQFPAWLGPRWAVIRQPLHNGTYEPSPVRRKIIDKQDGGQRQRGIPKVLDRLIQQAKEPGRVRGRGRVPRLLVPGCEGNDQRVGAEQCTILYLPRYSVRRRS